MIPNEVNFNMKHYHTLHFHSINWHSWRNKNTWVDKVTPTVSRGVSGGAPAALRVVVAVVVRVLAVAAVSWGGATCAVLAVSWGGATCAVLIVVLPPPASTAPVDRVCGVRPGWVDGFSRAALWSGCGGIEGLLGALAPRLLLAGGGRRRRTPCSWYGLYRVAWVLSASGVNKQEIFLDICGYIDWYKYSCKAVLTCVTLCGRLLVYFDNLKIQY